MEIYALDMHMMVTGGLKSGHHDFRANLKRLVYISIFNSSGLITSDGEATAAPFAEISFGAISSQKSLGIAVKD